MFTLKCFNFIHTHTHTHPYVNDISLKANTVCFHPPRAFAVNNVTVTLLSFGYQTSVFTELAGVKWSGANCVLLHDHAVNATPVAGEYRISVKLFSRQ